jgi:hypothetical protein
MKEKILALYDSVSREAASSIYRFTSGRVSWLPVEIPQIGSERDQLEAMLTIAEQWDVVIAEIYVEAMAIADKSADPEQIQDPLNSVWNMDPEQIDAIGFITDAQNAGIRFESDTFGALVNHSDVELERYMYWKDPVGTNNLIALKTMIDEGLEAIDSFEDWKKISKLVDEMEKAAAMRAIKAGIAIGMNLILQGTHGAPAGSMDKGKGAR